MVYVYCNPACQSCSWERASFKQLTQASKAIRIGKYRKVTVNFVNIPCSSVGGEVG